MNDQKTKEQNYEQIDDFRESVFGVRTGIGSFFAIVTTEVNGTCTIYNGVKCSIIDNRFEHVDIVLLGESLNIPHPSFTAAFQLFNHTDNTLVITGLTNGVTRVTIAKI